MTKVTVNLDETEEKVVNVLKALKSYGSKEKAIKDIIREYGINSLKILELIEKIDQKG